MNRNQRRDEEYRKHAIRRGVAKDWRRWLLRRSLDLFVLLMLLKPVHDAEGFDFWGVHLTIQKDRNDTVFYLADWYGEIGGEPVQTVMNPESSAVIPGSYGSLAELEADYPDGTYTFYTVSTQVTGEVGGPYPANFPQVAVVDAAHACAMSWEPWSDHLGSGVSEIGINCYAVELWDSTDPSSTSYIMSNAGLTNEGDEVTVTFKNNYSVGGQTHGSKSRLKDVALSNAVGFTVSDWGPGQITFANVPGAQAYRVDWAPLPGGPWSTNWPAVSGISPGTSSLVTTTVSIPHTTGFFRVDGSWQ